MFPAVQRASQPTLAVCLLRDCRKSQCNIHSVRLGKPISYFSLDYSGLERLSQSLSFRLPLCCTSCVHSLHLFLTLPSTFPLSCFLSTWLHSISHLFPLYIPLLRSPHFFSLPSAVINHNKRQILHWQPGRA